MFGEGVRERGVGEDGLMQRVFLASSMRSFIGHLEVEGVGAVDRGLDGEVGRVPIIFLRGPWAPTGSSAFLLGPW